MPLRALKLAVLVLAAALGERPGVEEMAEIHLHRHASMDDAGARNRAELSSASMSMRAKHPTTCPGKRVDCEYTDHASAQASNWIQFLQKNTLSSSTDGKSVPGEMFDNQTALFVIDVQNDFVSGTFGQPCWQQDDGWEWQADKRRRASNWLDGVLKTMQAAIEGKSIIILSKDLHPVNHCSFASAGRDCDNHEEDAAKKRYSKNGFPDHCAYKPGEDLNAPVQAVQSNSFAGGPTKSVGADLAKEVETLLKRSNYDKQYVIFKGFSEHYDSFSAMPHHDKTNANALKHSEADFTGGYAFKDGQDTKCITDGWNSPMCLPSMNQMANPKELLRPVTDILATNGIAKVVVIGLVFDWCVLETATYSRTLSYEVTVPASLTRPALDNLPEGLPISGPDCPYLEGVLKAYKDKGVKVI